MGDEKDLADDMRVPPLSPTPHDSTHKSTTELSTSTRVWHAHDASSLPPPQFICCCGMGQWCGLGLSWVNIEQRMQEEDMHKHTSMNMNFAQFNSEKDTDTAFL